MGIISLQCLTINGTRLVGMSYTHSLKDGDNMQDNYVAIVQSNENPTSIDNMSWSLIAAWPREMYYPQDYSPMVCHVNQQTGVFTMMSAFNLTDPNYTPDPSVPQRPSGGFQYDPQTSHWTNFSLSPDYLWGDVTDSFAVFEWPGTTTLVQANVGTASAVALGVMSKDAKGVPQFVNALNWTLDPLTHGYPTRLVYGNNVLYQFGTLLANNRTGQLNTILTRIPLSGSLDSFMPPDDLPTYSASSMSDCAPGYLSTSFYKDVLYVFCQGADGPIGPGPGIVMRFKDGPTFRDKALSSLNQTDIDRLSGAAIQPIGGNTAESPDPFAFVVNAPGNWPVQSIYLGEVVFGDGSWSDYNINITASYGDIETDPPNHSPAIIGGSVAGGLVAIALILYFVLRKRWPAWRRKLRTRILEAMMKEDQLDGSDKDCINKIEHPSPSTDLDGRDKILVTEDMEEHGIDVSTGYMREIGLEHHPRPKITTTMAESNSEHDTSSQHTATSGFNNRTIGHSVLLTSTPTTSPYGQDYELTAQQPGQSQSPTTIGTANNSSSSIWTKYVPPLPKAHQQQFSQHPTAPYIYTHSHSSLSPLDPPPTGFSSIPFRSTGSPPIPSSISSKEHEAWSQVHGTSDSAPPYSQAPEEHPRYNLTYRPSSSSCSSSASSSLMVQRPVAFPITPVPSAPSVVVMPDHQSPGEQSIELMPGPIPRAPQAICIQSPVVSDSFPSLGFAAGVSRRTRRSF